jgi:oxygen-independent coproporphyrinogen-3 oxidase
VSGIYSAEKEHLYIGALKKEILNISRKPVLASGSRTFTSLYIGGGTPTSISQQGLEDLIGSILRTLPFKQHYEATIEANPGTVEREKLRAIRSCGINRISIGVQSFENAELEFLGRLHTAHDAEQALERAHEAGFDNSNIDLIFGIPGQDIQTWGKTLERAVRIRSKHISVYELSFMYGTVLYEQLKNNRVECLDDEKIIAMYKYATDYLCSQGFIHYEISNFALPRYVCMHNLNYWSRGEYYGAGLGAHSYVGGKRFSNTDDFEEYIRAMSENKSPVKQVEHVTRNREFSEALFLGLRKNQGINLAVLSETYGKDVMKCHQKDIRELLEEGLLEIHNTDCPGSLTCSNNNEKQYMRLTEKGRLLSNEVFVRFI